MIVVEIGGQLHLVTQRDHAHLSAQILALIPALCDEPRREVLLRATRRHDDGWQGADAAPSVDETGRPHDFLTLPWDRRREVWDRGTALDDLDPAAALLIAEHAVHLHTRHPHGGHPDSGEAESRELEAARSLVELLEARRAALREGLGDETSREVSALYPWLRAMDLLSLIVVNRWQGRSFEVELPSWDGAGRAELRDRVLFLDPFPLAGTTTLHYAERIVGPGPYHDAVDLGVTLACAQWRSDRVTLRSLPEAR